MCYSSETRPVICHPLRSCVVQHQLEHKGVSVHPMDIEDVLSLHINDKVTGFWFTH